MLTMLKQHEQHWPRSSLTQGSSAGSPPPGEAQAPPGALYIFPWPPLYFPSAETGQIKERLNLTSFHTLPFPFCFFVFFSFPATKVERRRRMDAGEGAKCLSTHLKQLAAPLRGSEFYDCRGAEGKYGKRGTGEWRGREKQVRLAVISRISVVIPWERRLIIIQRLHSSWTVSVC